MASSNSSNSSSPFDGDVFSLLGNDTVTGGGFHDGLEMATLIIDGICTFAFLVLIIMSWWIRGKTTKGRKVFGVFYVVLCALFLGFTRSVVDDILRQRSINLPRIFVILPILKQVLANIPDTTLLNVVHVVIRNRLAHIRGDDDTYEPFWRVQQYGGKVMILLGVADAAMFGYAKVSIANEGSVTADNISFINQYRTVHMVYTGLFFGVTLEILGSSIFVFEKLRRLDNRNLRTPIYLIRYIAPFLVIRALTNFLLTIVYLQLAFAEQKSTALIIALFTGLPIVITCAGLVLVGFQPDWFPSVDLSINYPDMETHHNNYDQEYTGNNHEPGYNGY